jgi:hypothetical protein
MESLVDCFDALDRFRIHICTEFGVQTSQSQGTSPHAIELDPIQVAFHLGLDEHLHPLLARSSSHYPDNSACALLDFFFYYERFLTDLFCLIRENPQD